MFPGVQLVQGFTQPELIGSSADAASGLAGPKPLPVEVSGPTSVGFGSPNEPLTSVQHPLRVNQHRNFTGKAAKSGDTISEKKPVVTSQKDVS